MPSLQLEKDPPPPGRLPRWSPRGPSPKRFGLLGGETPTAGLSGGGGWRHRLRGRRGRRRMAQTLTNTRQVPRVPGAVPGSVPGRGSALNRATRCPRQGAPAAALQTETRGASHKPAATGPRASRADFPGGDPLRTLPAGTSPGGLSGRMPAGGGSQSVPEAHTTGRDRRGKCGGGEQRWFHPGGPGSSLSRTGFRCISTARCTGQQGP